MTLRVDALHWDLAALGAASAVAALALSAWRPLLRTTAVGLAALVALAAAATWGADTAVRVRGLEAAALVVGAGFAGAWCASILPGRSVALLLAAAAAAVFVTVPDTELPTAVGAALAVCAVAGLAGSTPAGRLVTRTSELWAGLAAAAVAIAAVQGSAGWRPPLLACAGILALLAVPGLWRLLWRRRHPRSRPPRLREIPVTVVLATSMVLVGRLGGVRTSEERAVLVSLLAVAASTALVDQLVRRRRW